MIGPLFRLRIPVEGWEAAEYVPAAAVEAVELAGTLTDAETSVDLVALETWELPLVPTKFHVVATLRHRHDERTLAVQVKTMIIPANDHENLGSIEVRATTTWSLSDIGLVLPDAVDTYAHCFGGVDPLSAAADKVEEALGLVGVDAIVEPDEALRRNTRAVYEMANQPPMSSPDASPLNPYALKGIPGLEAEAWAAIGFPADFASWWRDSGFDPEDAGEWLAGHFDPHDAVEWTLAGFDVDEAVEWRDDGCTPQAANWCSQFGIEPGEVTELLNAGFDFETVKNLAFSIDPSTLLALHDLVDIDEMEQWQRVLNDRDLLGAHEARVLISENVTAHEAMMAPSDFTAGEILAHVRDDDAWSERPTDPFQDGTLYD